MTHQLRGHLIWKGGQVLLCVIELLFSETKQFVPNPPIGSRTVKWPPLKEHYPGAPCRNGKIERKHVAKCRAPGGGAVLLNMVFLSDSWELTEARPGPSVGQASLSPLPPTLTPRFLGPRGGGPPSPSLAHTSYSPLPPLTASCVGLLDHERLQQSDHGNAATITDPFSWRCAFLLCTPRRTLPCQCCGRSHGTLPSRPQLVPSQVSVSCLVDSGTQHSPWQTHESYLLMA